jgi:hypothetical protein
MVDMEFGKRYLEADTNFMPNRKYSARGKKP